MLGRVEEALRIERDVYSGYVKLNGEEARDTLHEALNFAMTLRKAGHKPEAKEFLRTRSPVADRALGRENYISLRLRWLHANSLCDDADATLDELVQAEATLKSVLGSWRRIMGASHPDTIPLEHAVVRVQAALAAHQSAPGDS